MNYVHLNFEYHYFRCPKFNLITKNNNNIISIFSVGFCENNNPGWLLFFLEDNKTSNEWISLKLDQKPTFEYAISARVLFLWSQNDWRLKINKRVDVFQTNINQDRQMYATMERIFFVFCCRWQNCNMEKSSKRLILIINVCLLCKKFLPIHR